MKVLIIDDDDDHQALFAEALAGLAEVDRADTTDEGFLRATSRRYDGIIIDNRIDGQSGFVLLHLIAKLAGCPPIAFVSSYLAEDMRRNALSNGAVMCLDKSEIDYARFGKDFLKAIK